MYIYALYYKQIAGMTPFTTQCTFIGKNMLHIQYHLYNISPVAPVLFDYCRY